VSFNLFSEAEPFAAILIAHGTHVFFGAEGPKFEGGVLLGEVAASPYPPDRRSGGAL